MTKTRTALAAAALALGIAAPKDRSQRLFGLWLGLPARQKLQSVAGTWKRVVRERLWRPVRITGVGR